MQEPENILRGLDLIRAYETKASENGLSEVFDVAASLSGGERPTEDGVWIMLLEVLGTIDRLLLDNFMDNDVPPGDLFDKLDASVRGDLHVRGVGEASIRSIRRRMGLEE